MEHFEHYKSIVMRSFHVIRAVKGVFELQAVQEFLELAFSADLMEILFVKSR